MRFTYVLIAGCLLSFIFLKCLNSYADNPRQTKSFYQQEQLNLNLAAAVRKGDVDEMERLIEAGADVNAMYRSGKRLFYHAISPRQHIRSMLNGTKIVVEDYPPTSLIIIEILIRKGADAGMEDSFQATPLHYASYFGYEEAVNILLEKEEVDVNARDSGGNTPLHLAKNERIVQILLDKKAVYTANALGLTPFNTAQNIEVALALSCIEGLMSFKPSIKH